MDNNYKFIIGIIICMAAIVGVGIHAMHDKNVSENCYTKLAVNICGANGYNEYDVVKISYENSAYEYQAKCTDLISRQHHFFVFSKKEHEVCK